ncbi:MAG: stage III sporulation protein AF [Oscillospiraceae bacterium]
MEGIRLIGISICITTVVTSIFSMLTPNTKLDKVLKFAISLFFLTSIVSPFVNNKLDFRIDISDITQTPQTRELSQSIENQFVSIAKSNIENTVGNLLLRENISSKKIEVLININEDNSISINKLMVYINKSDEKRKQDIEKIVKEGAGFAPQVEII